MFIKRFISSLILILVFILSLFIFPKWFFAILIIAFCSLATYEFFVLMEKGDCPTFKVLGTIIAAAIPLAVFSEFELTRGWELFLIVLTILILFIIQFTKKSNRNAIVTISVTLFGVFYASWLLSFVLRIFMLPRGSELVLFLLVVTKMGDVAAYAIGSNFGKHPLIKRISPKKTIEGAASAFLTSLLISCLFKFYFFEIPLTHLFSLGLLLGGLGQIGDLTESLIKRDCEVKDSGFLVPGFGGVLDLVDSILFTAPALYFYLTHTAII